MPTSPIGARLLLGPVLRHVGATTATVWVQEQHYALVEISGLEPGSATTYRVHLDGQLAWPRPRSPWPDSRIRTRGSEPPVRVVFCSCRRAKPDDPSSAAAPGADALDGHAARMATLAPQDWPDALLLLGDQVYADEPPPQTRRWLDSRRDTTVAPGYEVADFTEYVQLYLEGWSDPQLRWLMSTVPTAMLGSDEFSWVERAVSEDAHQAGHVLIGSSLPWLLAPAIHDVQSATAAACARGSALGERIRQALDLEHWAAFRGSFHRLAAVLQRVAAGPDAPATISVLSGDVHHSYAACADVEGAPVYQLVSSPVHHSVPWYATVAVRAAWWGSLAAAVRSVVRLFGVADPTLSWRLLRAASWSRYPGSRWQVR